MKPVSFRATRAPHLHASGSVPQIYWGNSAALFPLLILSLVVFRFQALKALAVLLLAAAASEWICAKIFNRKPRFLDGASLWSSLLLFLLLPESLPPTGLAAGIFVSIYSRELFGGRGTAVLNAALVGHAFLQMTFPTLFRAGTGIFYLDSGGLVSWLTVAALFLGAAILFWRKTLEWEIPLIYIAILLLLEHLDPWTVSLSLRRVCFAGLFFLIEPGTLPLTRRGRRLAAFLAGALTWMIEAVSNIPMPDIFAVLLVNLLTGWLDQWVTPAGVRAK